jgi:hypothetical protein
MTDIVKGFADLLAALSADPAQDSAERQKLRADRDAAVIARNESDIEAEWRSLGLEPHRTGDGRLVSVALARMMGLRPTTKEDHEAA